MRDSPESNRLRHSKCAASTYPIYPLFAGIARPARYDVRKGTSSNRHILSTIYGVQTRTDFECPHSVVFFALSGQCALPAGRTLSRLCLPHPAGGVQTPWCLCTSTSDAGISAPRWAQIGNVSVSFHAVSIHTEGSAPRLFFPAVLMRTLGHILSGAVTDRRLISLAAKNSK